MYVCTVYCVLCTGCVLCTMYYVPGVMYHVLCMLCPKYLVFFQATRGAVVRQTDMHVQVQVST